LDFKDVDLHETWRAFYACGLTCLLQPAVNEAGATAEVKEEAATNDTASAETSFPQPWQRIYQAQKGPVPCVWTYWELARDLTESFSPERRKLFKSIVQALAWPSGRIVFWPLSQEVEGGLIPRTDCFWSGLRAFAPKYLVCFGLEAFATLFPDQPNRYGRFSTDGLTVVYIPGPSEMLPDNRAAKQVVWKGLTDLTWS